MIPDSDKPTEVDLEKIRRLTNHNLSILIAEINDNGWVVARKNLETMMPQIRKIR